MRQEDYRSCMAENLKGKKGLTKEERQSLFCISSRICSGKAKSREEAKVMCSQPKQPKPPKKVTRGKTGLSCEEDMLRTAQCVVDHIDMNMASNINSVGAAVANALIECRCPNETP